MGIGVSYTGYDGATRHKVVESAAELPGFMGAKAPRIGDTFRFGSKRRPESAAPSAVTKNDPVDGPLIGIEGNESPEPDGQVRVVGSRGGWRIPVTRTEMKVEPSLEMKCNEVTLTKLQYDLIISENGLVKGRTVERKVWEKSFFVLSENGEADTGKYGVMMFSDAEDDDPVHPTPKAFAFGDEASLSTYDKESGRFLANYDQSGNVKEDPPVKVIEVKTCPGAVPSGGDNGT